MSWQGAVERTVTGMGYDLVDTERSAGGLLRVYIDRLPGHAYETGTAEAVMVEDCELVTRQLQHVLEVEGVDYARLEVSSPGLDRPLRKPADWERFSGCEIDLTLRLPFQNRRKWRGTLQPREGAGWRLVLPAEAGAQAQQAMDFELEEVREARLVPVIDFKGRRSRPPEPNKQDGGQD